ncbi:MAG: GNAT family N-acetyltransferase [Xanthomonadales bacterium]|nr:GNAT family N-acetyltransferase [Xanthomonadales bacterium]
MSLSVQLRTPTVVDAPALVSLLTELGYSVPEATVLTNIENLANTATDRAWVAESTSGIVGFISVHLIPLFHAPGYLGRITSLIVRSNARGNGVGGTLMHQAQDFCWGSDCERIELTSGDHREQAHHFYEQLGFQVQSRRFVKHGAPPNNSSRDFPSSPGK